MNNLIFVDCEAHGPCPGVGVLTEFGAVDYKTRQTFHGRIYERLDNPDKPQVALLGDKIAEEIIVMTEFDGWLHRMVGNSRPIFVSDNPAYDFQWINHAFHTTLGLNPFGHSARRISDFYAGVMLDFSNTQTWKKWRKTPHDHNPVNDAMGNVEAFSKIMETMRREREQRGL